MSFEKFIDTVRELTKTSKYQYEIISEIKKFESDDPLVCEMLDDYDRISELCAIIMGLRSGYQCYIDSTSYGARLSSPAYQLTLIEQERVNNKCIKKRWEESGTQIIKRKRIALKTDKVWEFISFFGFPFPPFDVCTGYGVDDIDFDKAVRLGLITDDYVEDEKITPPPNPEYSLSDYDYMRAVCNRIVSIIK